MFCTAEIVTCRREWRTGCRTRAPAWASPPSALTPSDTAVGRSYPAAPAGSRWGLKYKSLVLQHCSTCREHVFTSQTLLRKKPLLHFTANFPLIFNCISLQLRIITREIQSVGQMVTRGAQNGFKVPPRSLCALSFGAPNLGCISI